MGASMMYRIVLAAAIILVLALAETTDDVKLGLENISKAGHPRTASLSIQYPKAQIRETFTEILRTLLPRFRACRRKQSTKSNSLTMSLTATNSNREA